MNHLHNICTKNVKSMCLEYVTHVRNMNVSDSKFMTEKITVMNVLRKCHALIDIIYNLLWLYDACMCVCVMYVLSNAYMCNCPRSN